MANKLPLVRSAKPNADNIPGSTAIHNAMQIATTPEAIDYFLTELRTALTPLGEVGSQVLTSVAAWAENAKPADENTTDIWHGKTRLNEIEAATRALQQELSTAVTMGYALNDRAILERAYREGRTMLNQKSVKNMDVLIKDWLQQYYTRTATGELYQRDDTTNDKIRRDPHGNPIKVSAEQFNNTIKDAKKGIVSYLQEKNIDMNLRQQTPSTKAKTAEAPTPTTITQPSSPDRGPKM